MTDDPQHGLQQAWARIERARGDGDPALAVQAMAESAEPFADWEVEVPLARAEAWLREREAAGPDDPWLLYLLGCVWSAQRRHTLAVVTLRRADRRFAETLGDDAGPLGDARFFTQAAIGVACERDGRLDQARVAFTEAARAAGWDMTPETYQGAERRWVTGDRSGFMAFYLRAVGRYEQAGLEQSLTRAYHNLGTRLIDRGEPTAARRFLQQACEVRRVRGSQLSLANSLNSLGVAERHLGLLASARDHLKQAAALARDLEHPLLESYAVNNLAEVARDSGRIDEALGLYQRSLASKQQRDDAFGLAHTYASLADCHLLLGATGTAREWVDRAVRLRVPGPDDLETARLLACQARAGLADGDPPAEVMTTLVNAAAVFAEADAKADLAVATWWQAAALHAAGDPRAVIRAGEALQIAGENRLEHLLAPHVAQHPGLLALAAEHTVAAGSARVLAGLPIVRRLRVLAGASPGGAGGQVAIHTLGGFRVVRPGRPPTEARWRSRKARELLKLLVAKRGVAVPREWLAGALWTDGTTEQLRNRLSVALTAVRRELDGGRGFARDHFVVADRDTAALALAHVWVDVEQLLADVSEGMRLLHSGELDAAIPLLRAAASRYTGEFLPENLYDDWATPLRDEARAAHLAAARALAAHQPEDPSNAGHEVER